jgi:hypothetical protein
MSAPSGSDAGADADAAEEIEAIEMSGLFRLRHGSATS